MPFMSANGQRIFYEDSGTAGLPIVMMHGFLMDQSLFDHQVTTLASSYRCIRFDARAFGKTAWDGKEFSLYDTVADCIALMDFLHIKEAVIMGMSQGGYAALRFALHHPDRTLALVLMSTQGGVDDMETIAQFKNMRDTWITHGPVEPLLESLATVLLGNKSTHGMDGIWNQWLPKWKALSSNAVFHGMNNLLNRDDIWSRIKEITQPALVTHGDADFGMPMTLGKALAETLQNCKEFVAVPGAAHAANFTHPELINKALVNFLDFINEQRLQVTSVGLDAP